MKKFTFGAIKIELEIFFIARVAKINEPPHDKTNKMICVPSEDSD